MAEFIRIGRLVINVDQVCAVARAQAGDETVVFINGKGPRDTGHFVVTGPDSEKVWKFFTEGRAQVISEVS